MKFLKTLILIAIISFAAGFIATISLSKMCYWHNIQHYFAWLQEN
jgi:hypothetical protein